MVALETGRIVERLIIAGCVPLLFVIGYKLLVLGVTGDMQIAAGMKGATAKFTRVTPGALCFILAIALGAYCLFSRYTTSDTVSTQTSTVVSQPAQQSTPSPPPPGLSQTGAKSTDSPTKLASLSSETTKSTEHKSQMEYLNGGAPPPGQDAPLSYQLRVAIDDMYYCGLSKQGEEMCRDAFLRRYKRIPQAQDLEAIEHAERDKRSNRVALQMKGNDEYLRLREIFVK